jgi:hypothetical protein
MPIGRNLNTKVLRSTLKKHLRDNYGDLPFQRANNIFERYKKQALKDFDDHPVTQEIEGGETATNISQTLDGYGNLFSFIGFDAGDDPVGKLRTFLLKNIDMDKKGFVYKETDKTIFYRFKVVVPTRDEIDENSPMPDRWAEGGGWATKVDKYISGLNRYLYEKSGKGMGNSYSGTAIQVKPHTIRQGQFKPNAKKYISAILSDFRSNFNSTIVRTQ